MTIGIIVEPYEEENTSGISYAIMSQAKTLLQIDKGNDYILYTHKPITSQRFEGRYRNVLVPKSFLGKNAWFLFACLFKRRDIPRVLLFNMPLLPMVLPWSVRTIPIFYELSAYQKTGKISPSQSLRRRLYAFFEKEAVRRASYIVTASSGPRADIMSYFSLSPEKVLVIPLGFQKFEASTDGGTRFKDQRNHFLFVGRVKHKKNVHTIVDGFIAFRQQNPSEKNMLFVVGLNGGRYYESIVDKVRQAGLAHEVVFTGFVSDADMYYLYKNAQALVFCSLQEGFGMPILEAMDFGIPVITSNRAPMNEVGGDAALIVDPENVLDITKAMETLAFKDSLRNDYIRKGREHVKLFSWDTHARKLLEKVQSSL